MKKLLLLTCFVFAFWGCANEPQNIDEKVTKTEAKYISEIATLSEVDALNILKTHCYSCHNPKSESHDNMLAPPLAGIKHKYKQLYSERSEFISKMADFVIHPSKENAGMKGPVRRFGLMPKTTLVDKEIFEIVAFIYDSPLEYPEWFPKHFEEHHGEPWESKNNN
jgi:hypothetical protein